MAAITKTEAEKELIAGQRIIKNLAALLQAMELVVEAQDSGGAIPDFDWWGLVDIAQQQVASVSPHLENVETFLLRLKTE